MSNLIGKRVKVLSIKEKTLKITGVSPVGFSGVASASTEMNRVALPTIGFVSKVGPGGIIMEIIQFLEDGTKIYLEVKDFVVVFYPKVKEFIDKIINWFAGIGK